MTAGIWTILGRELHEQARNPWTYWLRVGLAILACGLLWNSAWQAGSAGLNERQMGLFLFGGLQAALFAVIWVAVPFMVCDTLSREKRQGTLGLLFLTPLRTGSVVTGKCLAHAFRALALLAVFAPVLAVPWLLGGVGWRQYLVICCLDITSLGLAMSAGLLASALAERWSNAVVLAAVLASACLLGFAVAYRSCLAPLLFKAVVGTGWLHAPRLGVWESVMNMAWGTTGANRALAGSRQADAWLILNAGFAMTSLALTVGVIHLVAFTLRASLRSGGPSRWRTAWCEVWTRPRVAKSRLRRKMHRALSSNPVGWLHQRRTTARMVKWSWCLTAVLVWVWGMTWVHWNNLQWLHFWLCAFLAVGLSLSAASSFRTEQECGAFELLLITPLRERDIIWGRLRALWAQFAPGFAVILGASAWWSIRGGRFSGYSYWRTGRGDVSPYDVFHHLLPWVMGASWLALPAIGLRASLVCRTFLRAWLLTLAWGFFMPGMTCLLVVLVLATSARHFAGSHAGMTLFLAAAVVMQWGTAGVQLQLLHRRMITRRFRLNPA